MIPVLPVFNKNYFIEGKIRLPSHKKEGKIAGNQIFHYFSENLCTSKHPSTHEYIKKHLNKALVFENDASILLHGIQQSVKNNLILEFGVCSGKTINFIAGNNPMNQVYGFDSFEGITEHWQDCVPQKSFELLDKTIYPPLLTNILLIKGLFEDTLPVFSNKIENSFVSFVHIDCCVYNSTKTIFIHLEQNIQKGTIILFDEYFNYNGWENHEHKAFLEFIEKTKLNYKYIAYNRLHQQVLIQII